MTTLQQTEDRQVPPGGECLERVGEGGIRRRETGRDCRVGANREPGEAGVWRQPWLGLREVDRRQAFREDLAWYVLAAAGLVEMLLVPWVLS